MFFNRSMVPGWFKIKLDHAVSCYCTSTPEKRPNRRKSFTFYGQERPKRPKRPTLPAAKVERPERQKEVENFLTLCK